MTRLVLGLVYDKIVTRGMGYVERGWLTQDEYEEYRRYLYEPYKALGGNGMTDRVMSDVQKLPMKPRNLSFQIVHETKEK